jgi:hypothetical protein
LPPKVVSPQREGRSRRRKNSSIVDSFIERRSTDVVRPAVASDIDLMTFSDGEDRQAK